MKLKDIIDSVTITADNDYVFYNYTAWNIYEWEPVYVICEAYPTNPGLINSTASLRALPDKTLCQTGHLHTNSERIRIKDNRYTTVEDFNEAMGEYKIILKLLTPITYQLTPQQLKTLKGTNNIWSNANGPIEVKYWTH